MSDPILIWIVDDDKTGARAASLVVQEVASRLKSEVALDIKVLWANGFEWEPFEKFRASVDPNAPIVAKKEAGGHPSVVILDLFMPRNNGLVLEGDTFYYQLRKWEMHQPDRPSFVILWSPFQGEESAKQFYKSVVNGDQRLIPLATKSAELLRTKFEELLRRIAEEGD